MCIQTLGVLTWLLFDGMGIREGWEGLRVGCGVQIFPTHICTVAIDENVMAVEKPICNERGIASSHGAVKVAVH